MEKTYSPSGAYELYLMRDSKSRIQQIRAIHHLPLHCWVVSPARLLEDFGLNLQNLVVYF